MQKGACDEKLLGNELIPPAGGALLSAAGAVGGKTTAVRPGNRIVPPEGVCCNEMNRLLFCFVFFWAVFFSFAAFAQPAPKAKALRIGAVLSMTGDAASSGDAIRKGIALARQELEAQGWLLDINFQDAETNPVKAISAFQHLLTQNYRLFIGPTWSFEINAVKAVLERADAVSIAPAGSSDINGGPSKSIFNLCPARARQVSVLAAWLRRQTYKRAFVLTPLGDWGVVHRQVYFEALKEAGVALAGSEEFNYGLDPGALKSIFLKRRAQKIDLLLTTGGASDIANMLKARKDLQWRTGFLTTEDLWDVIDTGLLSASSAELREAWVLGLPLTGSFFEQFQARFDETPKVYADRGFDALMLLAKAAESAGDSTEAVRAFLTQTEFKGVSGEIKFDQTGDRQSGEYKIMVAFENKVRA